MSRKRCPDFAVILRATGSTEAVRDQIAECFYSELMHVAMRRCGDMRSAEDALQSGLLSGLEHLAAWRREGSLEAWLSRIVINTCTRLRSGMKNNPIINLPLEDSEDALAVEAPAIDMHVIIRQRLELIVSELSCLPADNADMFVLHEAYDLSLDELAVRFGLTVDGIKGRLKRTRSQLRARLLVRASAALGRQYAGSQR